MTQHITKSFKDIFSKTVLLFIVKMSLVSLAISSVLVWLFAGSLTDIIASYLSFIPWEWAQTTGASVASVLIAYMLFVLTLSVVTSLMIEPLLIVLAKKHYPNATVVGTPDLKTSLFLSLKAGGLFLGIFVFTFPLMFIPLLGAVYMLWLWSLLLKAPTIYDVSSLFITDKKEIADKTKKSTLLAMIAAGFNYIPIFNIFAPVFAQILFLHKILGEEA